jgi:uncharacterized protein YggU (UPF0235/DUF167 family)
MGQDAMGPIDANIPDMLKAGQISPHMAYIARTVAYIISGGEANREAKFLKKECSNSKEKLLLNSGKQRIHKRWLIIWLLKGNLYSYRTQYTCD